ncbi:MAG: VanZ family protein [Erysipelotrichaceae bacterium]|nr:VanZ family protein [Erysipelotrichaceae bacterium]
MNKFYKFMIWLIVIIYIGFIFSNSLQSGEISGATSMKLAKIIVNYAEKLNISMSLTLFHSLLRKLAHFIEFFGLGLLVGIAIATCPLFKSRILNFVIFLLAVPFTDEFIQRYVPDRVSTYKDMIIDATGMLLGGFFIYVSYLIIKDIVSMFNKKTSK